MVTAHHRDAFHVVQVGTRLKLFGSLDYMQFVLLAD
jgi:hypothetical protein